MESLTKKKCVACSEETIPLEGEELQKYADELGGNWQVIHEHHLEKEYSFKNFKEALEFTIKVGELAEKEMHHPDVHLSWGNVRVVIWTHNINGLSENDFILAAKCDQISR